MNKEFKFYIQKTVQWTPRFKQKTKTLTIRAQDSIQARDIVTREFPDWDISMFWVVWP